jgi:hypothetical protein
MTGRRFARVLLSDLPVKVICLSAAVILLLFHRVTALQERFFSVPLAVSTPAGLAVASSYPRTVRITLRGAEESIYPILEEDVEALVRLDGHTAPGNYRAEVKLNRKGTALNVEPLEIRVDPQEISFTLEPLVEKKVNVVADLRGAPAYGYESVSTSLSPSAVIVRGARSRVESVLSVPTEEIDLTGRTASFASKVKLLLPSALVRFAGDGAAEFRATIQEVIAGRSFPAVGITTEDLAARWAVKGTLPEGRVQVQGTQLSVDAVRPEQVRLVVDCSPVKRAGQYILHPRPEAPAGVTITDWSPREITIDVVASGS